MWTKEYPQEEGYYWFYGDPYVSEYHKEQWKAELFVAKVLKIPNGFLYTAEGHFFENKMPGLWQKIDVPELPIT